MEAAGTAMLSRMISVQDSFALATFVKVVTVHPGAAILCAFSVGMLIAEQTHKKRKIATIERMSTCMLVFVSYEV